MYWPRIDTNKILQVPCGWADTACFRPRIAGVPEEPLKPAPGDSKATEEGKTLGKKSVKVSHLCPSTTKASATFIFYDVFWHKQFNGACRDSGQKHDLGLEFQAAALKHLNHANKTVSRL